MLYNMATDNKEENKMKRNKKTSSTPDSDNDEKEEFNVKEYRKFLSQLFPSKYMTNKLHSQSNKKNKKNREESSDDDSDYETENDSEEDESSEYETEDEESYTSEYETEDSSTEEEIQNKKYAPKRFNKSRCAEKEVKKEHSKPYKQEPPPGKKTETKKVKEEPRPIKKQENPPVKKQEKNPINDKINIVFTIENPYEENEDSSDASESSESEVELDLDSESEDTDKDEKSSSKNKEDPINQETIVDNEVLSNLKELLKKNPNDKSIQKCIETYELDIIEKDKKQKKRETKQKQKNFEIFKKSIKDKNLSNELSFYKNLDLPIQNKLIKEVKELNKIMRIEKPYRIALLETNIPIELKASAMKKINTLKYMDQGSGEYYKIKNWIDTFMRIPFIKTEGLPISIDDGIDKCHNFMEQAQKTLNDAVYGLNDAKMQIMQLLGQLITNPSAIGTAIAIHGPPGTGKTSLIKEGISKILNRPFAFIALGGATDSSFLEGHGYTYEGSTWGKIVQILIESKCMNPVIYFDELDKISETPRGEEIAGILTHLTDTTQNAEFHDKYFSEIKFDLSKCFFIFSYNDETKVNPILKDRMYRIKTKGYNSKEKVTIANDYLLPKIREQVKFQKEDIHISDEIIHHIIETYCNKEDGVRNLKRCLEIIFTKLNLYRLMKPGTNIFEKDMKLAVEFPYKITKDIADKLIVKDDTQPSALWNMYV